MTAPDALARARVVAEARSWLGTPYHHRGRIKGAGVDCAMLPAEVYAAAGLVPRVTPAHYPPDWHLHRGDERYLAQVLEHAREVAAPTGPGDLVLFRFGRAFAHGAIIIDWPLVLHAYIRRRVELIDATQGDLGQRPRRFFTLWEA